MPSERTPSTAQRLAQAPSLGCATARPPVRRSGAL